MGFGLKAHKNYPHSVLLLLIDFVNDFSFGLCYNDCVGCLLSTE